jgi:hypothetical protein
MYVVRSLKTLYLYGNGDVESGDGPAFVEMLLKIRKSVIL